MREKESKERAKKIMLRDVDIFTVQCNNFFILRAERSTIEKVIMFLSKVNFNDILFLHY